MPDDVPPTRQVVVWVPPAQRPEAVAERARKAQIAEAQAREAAARLAVAKTREKHAEIQAAGFELVLSQFKKWLEQSQHPDFANSNGPVEPAIVLKIAEFVSKNYRLDSGQATENIAHALTPSIDFSRMSQEERDMWRALALKGGASDE